ncbi:DUF4258 domain-containing protein [Kocuria rhizophila]|nr:DUF4258 domain-containing protein [Kocuria rhizophila]
MTSHGRDRAAERGISQDDIREVLRAPYMSYPGKTSRVCYVGTTTDGRAIVVCTAHTLEESPDSAKVVSVWERGTQDEQ